MGEEKIYIISVSYGNDSIALMQWAHEQGLENCFSVYCDTGWAHPDWYQRVKDGVALAEKYGFTAWNMKGPYTFETMVLMKKGFPNQKMQFCSGILKIEPFGIFSDFVDPAREATVVIGKRREESQSRAGTKEFVFNSKYHDGRDVWHPLYKHTEAERDNLIRRAGFEPLPHRSMECCPCINANRQDLRETPEVQIDRLRELEKATGRELFRARRHQGAWGIDEVMEWAHGARGSYIKGQLKIWNYRGEMCESGLCGM